jgi:hypothetical protein
VKWSCWGLKNIFI